MSIATTELTDPSITDLLSAGLLVDGQRLTAAEGKFMATVTAHGMEILGEIHNDPTAAMKAVMPAPPEAGWSFWMLEAGDGLRRPLEHLRLEWRRRKAKHKIRTSVTHPLRIDCVVTPSGGVIGMTICPGKKGASIYDGDWDRDLQGDISVIRGWNPMYVISILENHEFELLGIREFPDVIKAQDFCWIHMEIPDSGTPDQHFEHQWSAISQSLHKCLNNKGRVLIHCRGGLGRTGVAAARLLTESGVSPNDAIAKVRKARPGAIETWEQEQYVRERKWI